MAENEQGLKLFDAFDLEDLDRAGELDAILAMATETRNYRLKAAVLNKMFKDIKQDLNIKLQSQLTLLDKDVQTDIEVIAGESTFDLSVTLTNIKTGDTQTKVVPMPIGSPTQAGIVDAAMFEAFTQMQFDITELYNSMQGVPRTAVVSGMDESPGQSDITEAFENAMNGSAPRANDRLVNADHGTEYIFTSDSTWIYFGRSSVGLATTENAGMAQHSELEGCVGYYMEGVGQVNGWDALKSAVSGEHR